MKEKLRIPADLDADVVAHPGDKGGEALADRQQLLVFGKMQRPKLYAEPRLSIEDGIAGNRATTEHGAGPRATELRAIIGVQSQPTAKKSCSANLSPSTLRVTRTRWLVFANFA